MAREYNRAAHPETAETAEIAENAAKDQERL
jgi:hypothetical protein